MVDLRPLVVRFATMPLMIPRASRRVIRVPGRAIPFIVKSLPVVMHSRFVYHQSMNVASDPDLALSNIAAAIGEPARARILSSLLDGRARTSTELAAVAGVSASTASVHLSRLTTEHLVKVAAQGRHRYYSLRSHQVARALETLSVLAGRGTFVSTTPNYLRAARTCYDHIAGTLGVLLHDRLKALKWLVVRRNGPYGAYDLTENGAQVLEGLGVDVSSARVARRRFAFACLDWSERRSHLGGAIGAALLELALKRKWVVPEPASRALSVTSFGRREMRARLGLEV
jgi:DNA-binding transcriptional ArsR family regulator